MSNIESPTTPPWEILESLRARFLNPGPNGIADYWTSDRELEAYDHTFAERIGWKWAAVCAELRDDLRWTPDAGRALVDWGCGTGIASRVLLSAFPDWTPSEVVLHDRSPKARRFASQRLQETCVALGRPTPPIREARIGESFENTLLLASHVIDEMSASERESFLGVLAAADAVLWVEPGTKASSRLVATMRERLKTNVEILAPCPHDRSCPMLAPDRARDWCHFFAPAPAGVFQSAWWGEFSRRMGIDLRSLPVSYLVFRRPRGNQSRPPREARCLGRSRTYKGYVTIPRCRTDGIADEWKVIRSRDRVTHDALKDGDFRLISR